MELMGQHELEEGGAGRFLNVYERQLIDLLQRIDLCV